MNKRREATAEELCNAIARLVAALRELHDMAIVDPHWRYEARSRAAFDAAAQLLKEFERDT